MKTISVAMVKGSFAAASPVRAQVAETGTDAAGPAPQPIQGIIEQLPAISGGEAGAVSPIPLVPGSDSFTVGRARSRMESAGFIEIGPLKQDALGIWCGMANRDAARVAVGPDLRGNVAAAISKAQ